jgi:hypothetical protein
VGRGNDAVQGPELAPLPQGERREATMTGDGRDTRSDVGTAATSSTSGPPAPTEPGARSVAGPVGAAGGAVAGAAAGTVTLGPIGTIIGAIAGAIGGGWTAVAAGAPTHYTPDHDREYREHYRSDAERVSELPYDTVRPAYQLGHFAARNPDYARRSFESIEGDLQRGWGDDVRATYGEWQVARRYAREAFVRERARSQGRTQVELNMGGSETHQRPSFSDPIAPADRDRVTGPADARGDT